MALDACNDAIAAALGRELTDREKGAVSRRALELKRRIDAAGGDALAVQSVLGDFGSDIANKTAIQRRNAAINYRVGQEKDAYRASVDFAKAAPAEVAKGQFVQSQKNYFGAKASLGTAQAREAYQRTMAYNADLMKSNVYDYAYKSGDDKNIWMARAALNDPAADVGALTKKYGKDAVTAAQIMEKHQEAARSERNLAGAWISRTPDYVTTRVHDPYSIARAGGNKFGSDDSFASWASDLKDMDWDRSFGGEFKNAPDASRLTRLKSQWNQFVAGKHLNFSDGGGAGMGSQNLGARASHEREIIFKTPEAEYNYWQTHGKTNSVAESVTHDLSRAGRDIATMREWGPNARANITSYLNRWERDVNEGSGPAALKSFQAMRKSIETRYLPALFDEISSPESGASHWIATLRQAIMAAKTGASLPASLAGDPILRASYAMRYAGDAGSTGSFLSEWGKAYGGLFRGVAKEDRANVAAEWGIRLHDMNMPLGVEYTERAGTGAMAKWTQMAMKTFGHSWVNNRQRVNHLAAEGFRDYTFRDKAFADLPDGRRQLMQQFGITDKMWDIIRRSEPMPLQRGQSVLAPSAIRAMDASEFKDVANGDSEGALKRARDLVADRYRNMHGELADTAVSEPNRNLRAILYGPSAAFTPWQRELYRSFFGLKNFMFNFMRNHLGGIALGQDADPRNVGWGRAMVRTMVGANGGSAMKMMATMLFFGQMMGYARNAVGDVVNGKTPENPFDFSSKSGNITDSTGFEAAGKAFSFQTLGLLSDFIISRGSRPNADLWDRIGGMAGPEVEAVGESVDDLSRLGVHLGKFALDHNYTSDDFYRDFRKDAGNMANTVYHSIPGNNLIWTKWATDAYLLDNMMEAINPGYKARLQQRAQKNGQTMLLGGGQ